VVRAKRKSLGLSQEKLAEKAGCDRQSINRVENAAYSPSLDRVFKLADALGMSLSDLFDEFDRVDANAPNQNGSAGRDVSRQAAVQVGDRAASGGRGPAAVGVSAPDRVGPAQDASARSESAVRAAS